MVTAIQTTTGMLAFDETGILAEEDGSPLLLADGGGRYWLDYSGGMSVGAWVRARGLVDHECASVSHQIAGRVRRNSIDPVRSDFCECGELVAGRDHVLLQTADQKRYVLHDSRDFRVGQRVRVRGTLVPLCVTLYDEGDGCVLNETLEPCE